MYGARRIRPHFCQGDHAFFAGPAGSGVRVGKCDGGH